MNNIIYKKCFIQVLNWKQFGVIDSILSIDIIFNAV